MTSIITDTLKRQLINNLYNDVKDSAEQYYIAIGRSEAWDSADAPPTPINTSREIRKARNGIQAFKTAEQISFVVPRYNWSSGSVYSAYDDSQVGYPTNAYYVMTDENSVYMVIQQSKNATGVAQTSTVKPNGSALNTFKTADGYVWKYLYTVGALQGTQFTSANFIPVAKVEDSAGAAGLSAIEVQQANIQGAAKQGEILGISMIAGGTGYTSAPTVTIVGNNTGKAAAATAFVSSGTVIKIEMNDSGTGLAQGVGYGNAAISMSGGGGAGASARAIISVDSGLGADARKDLKSFALMFNSKIVGTESGQFPIGNDFRQTMLIKNPKKQITSYDSDFVADAGNAMPFLKLSTISTAFTIDRTIQGTSSSAKAYVDYIDSSLVYFHQSEATGFGLFQEGEALGELNGNGDGIIEAAGVDADALAYRPATVNKFTGDVLYIDNRSPIERSIEQTEDIKVVIQL